MFEEKRLPENVEERGEEILTGAVLCLFQYQTGNSAARLHWFAHFPILDVHK